jgi:hypothetical protein
MRKAEIAYQARLCERIESMFPGCFILRNDPRTTQGLPDILVLIGSTWFMLEVKISADANHQPNQPYYVDMFNSMSFAAFIWPEIEDEVLNELQSTLRAA